MTDTPVVAEDAFDPFALVGEFQTAFEMDPYNYELWMTLIEEEYYELLEAMALDITDNTQETLTNVLKEYCDVLYVVSGFANFAPYGLDISQEFMERIVSAMAPVRDIFGVEKCQEAFKRVHASNMSKLVDGKPLRREDGKVLKGPNYAPPKLDDLVWPVYFLTNTDAASAAAN